MMGWVVAGTLYVSGSVTFGFLLGFAEGALSEDANLPTRLAVYFLWPVLWVAAVWWLLGRPEVMGEEDD